MTFKIIMFSNIYMDFDDFLWIKYVYVSDIWSKKQGMMNKLLFINH